ncbi:MAG: inorganic diphosphatase [Alphaproteobacteria bacterium]|nr:inorganic diphosphatase [Alphaproteobacteria bacterium]
MQVDKITSEKIPDEFNVIIEIPMNDNPVKYELDKESGAILVDRFMQVSMFYPCNYGFIPNTLSGDGDPVDVLVLSTYPIIPSAVVKCRPVGVLMMEDESGLDEKVIVVPVSKVDISFDNIRNITDVADIVKNRIKHFFEHYKDLDKDKWVKVLDWRDIEEAKRLIKEGVKRSSSN